MPSLPLSGRLADVRRTSRVPQSTSWAELNETFDQRWFQQRQDRRQYECRGSRYSSADYRVAAVYWNPGEDMQNLRIIPQEPSQRKKGTDEREHGEGRYRGSNGTAEALVGYPTMAPVYPIKLISLSAQAPPRTCPSIISTGSKSGAANCLLLQHIEYSLLMV